MEELSHAAAVWTPNEIQEIDYMPKHCSSTTTDYCSSQDTQTGWSRSYSYSSNYRPSDGGWGGFRGVPSDMVGSLGMSHLSWF